ncbi:ATP-binding cassette transporter CGR1 [Puccinia graminis f. sp. tritici]|uniref:ATP-binding cassette transporter CGR1 n=1 Tax=Puccinia graminis f. sp. tritici TaxID=56615 RepID=A0A5B0RWH7_PUCGR|nr:ATP-binding cassette transporter CGR1 [Puccinia graminis f. sp. tritici]
MRLSPGCTRLLRHHHTQLKPSLSTQLRSASTAVSRQTKIGRSQLESLSKPARPSRGFTSAAINMGGASHGAEDTTRPKPEQVLVDIAKYVHDPKFDDPALAYETARLCLIDTLGCGLEALRFPTCSNLLGPVVEGTVVPNGTRVPGTAFVLDPIRGAFNIGTMIRWLDYNDCFLAAEWGHPSDNLGSILAVADWLSRTAVANGKKPLKMHDVLTAMIQAHEIQGGLALENSFNRVGLDHVVLVKVASAAVTSKLLGLSFDQTIDVISQAFVDGQSLRTYRHAPNTGSRKSWAAGDACSRAVNLALLVQKGEMGYPTVLSAKTWGFYDVLFGGKPFKFQRPFTSYIMENVLFKISYPAEFHAQTAVECAHILHKKLVDMGKGSDDIKSVKIRTQEAAIRIIDKQGPLHNFADRDHTIQYMVAIPLIYGRLTTEDYTDKVASDPRIDELRAKISCTEEKKYSAEYHAPDKRSIGNAITIELKDGTVLDEVEIEYPVGHKRRREEGKPLLDAKFKRHIEPHFPKEQIAKIMEVVNDQKTLENFDVDKFMDLWVKS